MENAKSHRRYCTLSDILDWHPPSASPAYVHLLASETGILENDTDISSKRVL